MLFMQQIDRKSKSDMCSRAKPRLSVIVPLIIFRMFNVLQLVEEVQDTL